MSCGRGVTVNALVEPAYCTHPPYVRTDGPEVADLCDAVGFGPDPQQRLALDMIFATDAGGLPVAFEFGVVCARQNLKTGLFKQAVIGWLWLLDRRLVIWSAHEFATAQEAFRDLDVLVTGSDLLRRRVKAIHRGNGEEAIELAGDRRLRFKARTKAGGKGLTGDDTILDEAFALQPPHMGSLLPTMVTRRDAQVLYGSSAGLPESAVLRGVRDRGRVGAERLAYLEWCDDLPGDCQLGPACDHRKTLPGCRLDDERRWARANPTLGRRISVDALRAQRQSLPPAEFAREFLTWWDDPDEDAEELLARWVDCLDVDSSPVGRPALCLDVSPGSKSAAVVAGLRRPDGLSHLEVAAHDTGTGWVAEWARQRQAKHNPLGWVADPTGPAGGLLDKKDAPGPDGKLREAYLIKGTDVQVTVLSGRDMGQACEAFAVAIADKKLRHLGDQRLQVALDGAGRSPMGDGLWAWSRRKSGVDISPVVAATGALWGLGQFAPATPFFGAWR